jgi:hypothetical protein
MLPREGGARATPFGQALTHHQSASHYPYVSACFKSHLQVHGAHIPDYTASSAYLNERARRDLRDCDQNGTNCVNLPVCVPMDYKLFETPVLIG